MVAFLPVSRIHAISISSRAFFRLAAANTMTGFACPAASAATSKIERQARPTMAAMIDRFTRPSCGSEGILPNWCRPSSGATAGLGLRDLLDQKTHDTEAQQCAHDR